MFSYCFLFFLFLPGQLNGEWKCHSMIEFRSWYFPMAASPLLHSPPGDEDPTSSLPNHILFRPSSHISPPALLYCLPQITPPCYLFYCKTPPPATLALHFMLSLLTQHSLTYVLLSVEPHPHPLPPQCSRSCTDHTSSRVDCQSSNKTLTMDHVP
jgi:hypothetical protein